MTTLAYVDCVAGVAGDMLLGALIDAGADLEHVRAGLGRLGVAGLDVAVVPVERQSLGALHAVVTAPAGDRAHSTLADLHELVDRAAFPARVRDRAREAFRRLAEAEARVHRLRDPERVALHEVGGHDALADVCGVALALESLGVEEVVCSPLPLARGVIDAAHGRLPLPAPATLELLRGAPVHGVDLDVELVTPTGAALIATLAAGYGPLPAMRLAATGCGAGTRELSDRPNVTRVLVGEREPEDEPACRNAATVVECNLDDLPGELVPDAAERAFAAGALDVWTTPAQMKKGRPGVVLSALARPAHEREVARALLHSTTTLGVRCSPVGRWELERRSVEVAVDGHPVRVKVGVLDGEPVNAAPEHDDCAAIARRTGRSVKAVWAQALAAYSTTAER